MKNLLIFGLGNPGVIFARTRHNLGKRMVDSFLARFDSKLVCRFRSFYQHSTFVLAGYRIWILGLSSEFSMNESGRLLGLFLKYLWKEKLVKVDSILIVHDEIDFPLGVVKLKLGGRSAGHRGVQSIIDFLQTDKFYRLRVGIGKGEIVKEWVLQRFTAHEERVINSDVCPNSISSILEWMRNIKEQKLDVKEEFFKRGWEF